MFRTFTFIILGFFAYTVNAQTSIPVKYDQPYGIIDTADLTMEQCDFEKDAHAEVLFNSRKVTSDLRFIRVDEHVRIKIFDKNGEKYAAIRIPVFKRGYATDDVLRSFKAQTINLSGKNIIYTPVEKKYIYKERINENIEALCVSLPDIKPGSVFEVSWSLFINRRDSYPQWFPQGPIPVRYTQMTLNNISGYLSAIKIHISMPFACDTSAVNSGTKDETRTWALANLHSYKKEEYCGFIEDGIQYVAFLSLPPVNAKIIRQRLLSAFSIETNYQLLPDSMTKKLNAMNSVEGMIAYIFNTVKTEMKWNGRDDVMPHDHVDKAWQNRIGNSTEVNLILYDMLTQAGIRCFPLVVSTHYYPRVDFATLYRESFNRTVVYVPIDSSQNYILDATSKYNNYKQTPVDLLDLKGMIIENTNKPVQIASMIDNQPSIQSVFINASITSNAKMSGTATITGYSYNKVLNRQDIDTSKENDYKNHLTGRDNNIKILSLKFENMDVDTLPLIQHVDFDYDLGGVDGDYIYFKTNIFSALQKNPFTSETRFSDVYFGYRRFYDITGSYKIPGGYKIDIIPKNTIIIMPDSSIIFRRFCGVQEDGTVQVHYKLYFNKSIFIKSEYQVLREFYKKMYEALNEQIVLKKTS